MIRIERDYSEGEVPQFETSFPPELEGRVSPVRHLNVLNELNTLLASANDPYRSIFDNLLAVLTFYLSTLIYRSHFQRVSRIIGPASMRRRPTIAGASSVLAPLITVWIGAIRITSRR